MPRNTMTDLRNHLFEVLERLKDADEPMEIERARAVVEVGQVLINSAKVEVDMMRAAGASMPASRSFFAVVEEDRSLPVIPERKKLAS